MLSCAFDTMTVIYELAEGHADPAIQELHRRARILSAALTEQKATIILPTVVVSELLTGIEPANHGQFLATLQARFLIPPLDLRAAALAAQLWIEHRKLPPDQKLERRVLKADVLVVASAKVAGATVFYSHDTKARTLANLAKMEARDLPTHSEKLFEGAPPGKSQKKPSSP